MRNVMWLLLAAFAIGTSVMAEDAKPAPTGKAPGAKAYGLNQRQAKGMAALGLSDQQKTQMKAIRAKYAPKYKELKASSLTPDQKKAKMADLRKTETAEVGKILTPEQRSKLETWRKSQQTGRLGRGFEALGLSEQQKAEIKVISQKYQPKLKEVQDSKLTPEQKRAKMRTLTSARRTEVMDLLTPAQRTKLEQWMKTNRNAAGKKPAAGRAPKI